MPPGLLDARFIDIESMDDKGQYPESVGSLKGVLARWGDRAVNPEYDKAR